MIYEKCVHYEACKDVFTPDDLSDTFEDAINCEYCTLFKNKADFVEVVKCGECKFTDNRCAYGIVCICEHGGMQGAFVSKTDFCSYGKRRDT